MARVATVEVCRFMIDCLHAVGANYDSAEQQAKVLLQADRYGRYGQGINRLESYVNDILCGACKPDNQPEILKESASTAWVDGNNGLSAVTSQFAMDIAIAKAKQTGIGWVVVKGSANNGMGSYWAQKAANEGLIGMAFTNTPPALVPTRSNQAALGCNPIAVVAPASCGESFFLDMTTTATSFGMIDHLRRTKQPLKHGWALGPDCKETLDPDKAYASKRLLPLGGSEATGGYKGYGLAAMVEVLCGVSSGSRYGLHLKPWSEESDGVPRDIGHCFVAIDPRCFAPGFAERLADCIQQWRDLDRANASVPVLAPGDKEKIAVCKSDKTGSVTYMTQQISACEALAKRLKVKPMETCKI